MKFSANDLNRGIICFLGFGVDKFPHEHKDNLVSELGTDKAQVVEQEIAALINEINQHPIDWTEHSLVSAGEVLIKTMAERHPELSDAALRALAWKFTFDWR